MYEDRLTDSEKKEIANRLTSGFRTGKDRFLHFTDILSEYVGSGEWHNLSDGFLAMCAKASYLRGMYGYNQQLAKGTDNIICKGYAAAAYCRQSLDPRWLNNLRTYVNQSWQAKDYIAFAELSGQLASILIDLGYTERAKQVASESIEKVTQATAKDQKIRTKVQSALLRSRILMANVDIQAGARDDALVRLDSAEDTARILNNDLALTDVRYYRAKVLEESKEYDRATDLLNAAIRKYDRMGYLQGVADAKNLQGVLFMERGFHQEARDHFEELLVIQQQLNDQVGLAKTLINVGEIDRGLGQYDQMETYNQRALEISQEAEFMRGIAISKINLGDVSFQRGDFERALRYYSESMEVVDCSGMKDLRNLISFLIGDALFMLERPEQALEAYLVAKKNAQEANYLTEVFNAEVSILVTQYKTGQSPDLSILKRIKDVIGDSLEWKQAYDSSMMRDLRASIFQDSSIEGDMCIFYDREKNFECRVERQNSKTGCTGNLFWKISICPYYIEFLEKLEK